MAIPLKKSETYTPQTFILPGVDSPDETGEGRALARRKGDGLSSLLRYARKDTLSLRGSIATAAIPWSKVRNIYRALFQGDRHANARDDTKNLLSLRGSETTAAISREGGFPQGIYYFTLVVGYFATLNMT